MTPATSSSPTSTTREANDPSDPVRVITALWNPSVKRVLLAQDVDRLRHVPVDRIERQRRDLAEDAGLQHDELELAGPAEGQDDRPGRRLRQRDRDRVHEPEGAGVVHAEGARRRPRTDESPAPRRRPSRRRSRAGRWPRRRPRRWRPAAPAGPPRRSGGSRCGWSCPGRTSSPSLTSMVSASLPMISRTCPMPAPLDHLDLGPRSASAPAANAGSPPATSRNRVPAHRRAGHEQPGDRVPDQPVGDGGDEERAGRVQRLRPRLRHGDRGGGVAQDRPLLPRPGPGDDGDLAPDQGRTSARRR